MKDMISSVKSIVRGEVGQPVEAAEPVKAADIAEWEEVGVLKEVDNIEDGWEKLELTKHQAALIQLKKDIAAFMQDKSGSSDLAGYFKLLENYKAALRVDPSGTTPAPKALGLASF
jgi:hypothetical protein